MNKLLPKRKRNRLDYYDYNSCGMYFLTLCTAERRNLFWDDVGANIVRPQDVILSKIGKIVEKAIDNISMAYSGVIVEAYVIMPNHIHLLLLFEDLENGRTMFAPTRDGCGIVEQERSCCRNGRTMFAPTRDDCGIVEQERSCCRNGRTMFAPTVSRIVKQLKGFVSKRIGFAVWQKSFYDHVIRNQQDCYEHLRYIEENPLKWNLDKLYMEE